MSGSSSGVVKRRTFVKDAALAVAAAGGFTGGLGGLTRLLAQPRPSGSGSRLLRVTGQTRPFTMVCLGDSIMWGQGLRDSSKFTAKVEAWLESKLPGRAVYRYVYARSGATIGPDSEIPDTSRVEAWMNDPQLSEVPCSWPWVRQQVTVARQDLAKRQVSADLVDLVLLDGGANDLNVANVLDEFQSPEWIRRKTVELIGGQMPGLLGLVRAAFQNAKILVTGYYPIISEQSDLGFISGLVSILVPAPIAVGLTVDTRSRLATLSQAWYEASNAQLGQAVAGFNTRLAHTANPVYRTPPAAFAQIPWRAEHCYAAPEARLWLIGVPVDEVYWDRGDACASAGKRGNPKCLEAKMGHPNPAGADAYAAACQAQLTRYLPEWTGAKMMSACVEMDPMPAAGRRTTLTVHAEGDAPGGPRAVPATVSIGGQRFATDTPIPIALCPRRASTAHRDEGELAPPEVVTCTPIIVTAPGYMDVVIRDYLQAQALPR